MTKISDLVPKAAAAILTELPNNFYGRVVLIYEAGRLQRMEKKESFHVPSPPPAR